MVILACDTLSIEKRHIGSQMRIDIRVYSTPLMSQEHIKINIFMEENESRLESSL